jgi:hypothetical protein
VAINSRAVTVTTTATLLTPVAAGDLPSADQRRITVYNDGANTVYLGPAGVTASGATKGVPLPAGAYAEEVLSSTDAWYGITSASTSSVIVHRVDVVRGVVR